MIRPSRTGPAGRRDGTPHAAQQAVYAFGEAKLTVDRGHPLPLGATRASDGVNFVLIGRNATAVTLVLMRACNPIPLAEIPLDPVWNRTGYHWHIRVHGLPDSFAYGYRVGGPSGGGHRFDPSKILLDPAATALACGRPWGESNGLPRQSLMVELSTDRLIDVPPNIPREDSIIYEMHVRGFTVDPSSGVINAERGTFAGLIEKIPYLKELGITAVELLPIDEFDEDDCPFVNPFTGERLKNLWGYNTVAYAAPKAAYASEPSGSGPFEELRRMVRAFHEAGIEVILDVVFNHTAEGGDGGPTYSFRGLDNSLFYILDDDGSYLNFSGCGNTVNSNHPMVRTLVLSCLRNWVARAGVDGFRFDLASVFGRDHSGNVIVSPPVVEMISEDALLADSKLIAEPWDASGLYQVGTFPGGSRWMEWNGRYRDDVRRFWRGEAGMISDFATRLCGSDDLYRGRSPRHSVNFITCHDGFTLADLVSYTNKRNEINGEGNRDGSDANWSWNCGVEGPTQRPDIIALRKRQARNLIATLMVSQGVPMLLGGDEFLRTQRGNNNAWCQDNEISWVDWSLAESNADFLRFVKQMIALRKRHPALRRKTFFPQDGPPAIFWHGCKPFQPDFSRESRAIALSLDGRRCGRPGVVDRDIYMAFNASWEPHHFLIPASPTGRAWRRAVDTALPSPDDALGPDEGPIVSVLHRYRVEAHSLVILVSEST